MHWLSVRSQIQKINLAFIDGYKDNIKENRYLKLSVNSKSK